MEQLHLRLRKIWSVREVKGKLSISWDSNQKKLNRHIYFNTLSPSSVDLNSILIGEAQQVEYLIKIEGKWRRQDLNSGSLFWYYVIYITICPKSLKLKLIW
jgi:hypothetical protein